MAQKLSSARTAKRGFIGVKTMEPVSFLRVSDRSKERGASAPQGFELKSLILAQIERWRHALHMQVERQRGLRPGGEWRTGE